jgi:hypothetical protein
VRERGERRGGLGLLLPGLSRLVPHHTFSNSSTHAPVPQPKLPLARAPRPSTVTDTMPRITLWPRCRQVDVVLAGPQPPAGTALSCGAQPDECPTVQNLNSSGERKGHQSLEEERGAESEAEAEEMLRGGGSRASAKPRRPHSRQRPPSPPAPSRRGAWFRPKNRASFASMPSSFPHSISNQSFFVCFLMLWLRSKRGCRCARIEGAVGVGGSGGVFRGRNISKQTIPRLLFLLFTKVRLLQLLLLTLTVPLHV